MEQHAIVVVEDHAETRAALCEVVRAAQPRLAVLEAASGAEALALIRARQPLLVLMDVSLPDCNGIGLAAAFAHLFTNTAVIVVSDRAEPIQVDRAREAGAIGFVAKERVHEDLLPAIERALVRGRGAERP